MTKEEVVQQLRSMQGERKQKEFANSIGIHPSYLCDIYKGRRDPGPKVLEALGLDVEKGYTKK